MDIDFTPLFWLLGAVSILAGLALIGFGGMILWQLATP